MSNSLPSDHYLAQDILTAAEELAAKVTDIVDPELRLVVLSELLDGPVRRTLEGERQKLHPLGQWMHSTFLDVAVAGQHEGPETRLHVDKYQDANILYSEQPDGNHVVALDIDLPMRLVPSSTPGKGHLWIDKKLPWARIVDLLDVLAEVGIVHRNYREHSLRRGYTCLRPAFQQKVYTGFSSDDIDVEAG